MPSFLKRNEKQLSVEDGNTTRLVTKVRWVVESVNGRIKQWRLLEKVLPNSLIPYAGEYIRFVSAICNKYRPPLNAGNNNEDLLLEVEDGNDSVEDFPKLSEEDIRDITLGVYQLKLAKSYTEEHLENDEYYEVMQQGHQLIRAPYHRYQLKEISIDSEVGPILPLIAPSPLYWTPGHADIQGNDEAVLLAKQVAEEATQLLPKNNIITLQDVKHGAHKSVMLKWQRRW
ncbi:unnamed protein product [Mytilus coruscus]|uniref:DDE Tnp4 domain-containing protein n=1 Tax=Mytilus coruscus TaxID=42192 RepID=A0A6J8DWR2_MYTCO|nr:unnamed protein product [Mytilus coruscus]